MRSLEPAQKREPSENKWEFITAPAATGMPKRASASLPWTHRSYEVADRDLYVGWRSLQRSGINKLERGDRVSFDIGRAKDGRPEATNIQIIEALAA
jgi:cold shock CspA family protein